MRVREVMSAPAVVVACDTTVKEAARLLDEHGFTALPVVDAAGRLAGIVGEADVLADRLPPDPRLPVPAAPRARSAASSRTSCGATCSRPPRATARATCSS
ncbi:HPP family protein [Pseudonocardia benzenivorans]